jgi:hypothetical protein
MPAATSGTRIEVVIVEDCTATVTAMPTRMPIGRRPAADEPVHRPLDGPATSSRMFLVMNPRARKISARPERQEAAGRRPTAPIGSPSSSDSTRSTGYLTARADRALPDLGDLGLAQDGR